jgi:hypothetical protein
MANQPQVFDPNQPFSAANQAPSIAISSLSTIGVPAGTAYNPASYRPSQAGISAIVGFAPAALQPENPGGVPPSVIVRAG